jgi:hypothetical protein
LSPGDGTDQPDRILQQTRIRTLVACLRGGHPSCPLPVSLLAGTDGFGWHSLVNTCSPIRWLA